MSKRKSDQTMTIHVGGSKKLQCISDHSVTPVGMDSNSDNDLEDCSNEIMRVVDRDEEQKNRSISPSKKEDPDLHKQKLIWDDQWLEFQETPTLEEIKIDDQSALKWCPNFISTEESDALFDHLMEELNFEHTKISMYGKSVHLPRLQSWFAEDGLVVKELYQKQKQRIWTPPMRKLKTQLEKQLGVEFDYCLVNLYRDGNDYINFHADNEAKDIIASISLGATRKFLVRHLSCFGKTLTRKRQALTTPDKKKYEFSFTNGSLIVMLDDTQHFWKHSVPKEKKVKDPRINLTFRTMQDK